MPSSVVPEVRFRARVAGRSRHAGFTMIELMIAVAMLAVLASFAVPAFTSVINGNRLAGMSNELAATLQSVRMDAVRTGQRVIVCPTNDGAACTTGVQWSGWIAFSDANGNGSPQTAEILRVEQLRTPLELRVSTNVSGTGHRVIFRPDGFAYANNGNLLAANMSLCIPTARPPQNVRDVTITPAGAVSVSRRSGSGACTAPSNP